MGAKSLYPSCGKKNGTHQDNSFSMWLSLSNTVVQSICGAAPWYLLHILVRPLPSIPSFSNIFSITYTSNIRTYSTNLHSVSVYSTNLVH